MPEEAISHQPLAVSQRVREYDHAKHEPVRRVLRWAITHIGFRFLAKIEFDQIEGLENLPETGAAILMINHIAFIDPIVVLGSLPRNIVPMAKAEAYWIPIWGIFVWLWHVIPVRRGEADREALMNALAVLKAGEIVLVAPQGTRQPSLQSAKEGIAYLAYKSGAPIIPVAIEGSRGFPTFNLNRWKGPGARFKLGKPFRFKPIMGRLPREALKQMTDEAMYRLAAMLPEERRGIYADLSKATSQYIENSE
jgi:1-acyl-sn-glycerol-3-phosphate acyltransferase